MNPNQIPIRSDRKMILNLIPKDPADPSAILDVPEDQRAQILIRGPLREVAPELLKGLIANIEHMQPGDPLAVMVQGRIMMKPAATLDTVILQSAPRPVTIRRKSWSLDRKAIYFHVNGVLSLSSQVADAAGTISIGPNFNALDLTADDWVVVDNPNIVEEEYDFIPSEPPAVVHLEGFQVKQPD